MAPELQRDELIDEEYVSAQEGSGAPLTSPSERQYGTFEVSVIEVDGDRGHHKRHGASDSICSQTCAICSDDCCFVMAVLCMPIRLLTYKIVLFHLTNFAFAVGTSVWTILLRTLILLGGPRVPWYNRLRRLESYSLGAFLEVDAKLFNFISPPEDQVVVYSSSTSMRDESVLVSGFYAQLYFAFVKLLCTAMPGIMGASMFVWSLVNFFAVLAGTNEPALLAQETESIPERDIMILMSLLIVYGSALLVRVFAFIARHVTIFFCAEYLLYAE